MLEKIKKEIEDKGYKVVLREGEVSWLQCYIPYDRDTHDKFIAFAIELKEEGKIAFRDGNEQIPRIKTFSTKKDLFEHIENTFPIK